MYKEKYLKYKKKYLKLKGGASFIIPKTHKVLVIGGGAPYYCEDQPPELCGFYEIGNHPSSYYGIGKDWSTTIFWDELESKFAEDSLIFDAIIFDRGSESWLPFDNEILMEKIINVLMNYLNPNGILIAPVDFKHLKNSKLNNLIWLQGLNIIGIMAFDLAYQGEYYNILSHVDNISKTLLVNKQGIYPPHSLYKVPLKNPEGKHNGYYGLKKNFELVSEGGLIEFCKNRIIKS
jgi:hypothetical protein